MNGDERYLFDLQGFLVVEDALDANQLTALNDILDRRVEDEVAAEDHTHRFLDLLARLRWARSSGSSAPRSK
ncbi:MAG: hypothetical protein OXG36_09675, partial [Caldilineaceae bacterium]|nr:hypothetical protein [Caldilineaceae bacterium]